MSAADLLLPPLTGDGVRGLLVADENCRDFPFDSLPRHHALLSNRFDIAERGRRAGLNSFFSDFDFSPWVPGDLDLIACRIAKEKAVVHHIANRACDLLAPGGRLVLTGAKNEGIKTFAKTLSARLGSAPVLEKHGNAYRAVLERGTTPGPALDDQSYTQLREILELDGMPVVSKPGLFGWDRIDAGSALLAAQLPAFLTGFPRPPHSLVDLGCGYGYLSLMATRQGPLAITATDNCAAALDACRENFARHRLPGEMVAADAGKGISGRFDALLCNPPFHQGFGENRQLTETFLAAARRLLTRKGRALFVVNRFVPLEKLAGQWFGQVETVAEDRSFKVVALAG